MIVAMIVALMGIVFIVLGYLLWKKERISLLHEYHYDKVSKEDKKIFCAISGMPRIRPSDGYLWPVEVQRHRNRPPKTADDTVEVVLQINGKLRGKINLPVDCPKDEAIAAAKADERMASAIEGKTIVKEIAVPNKIVNIVVK